jgi:hypothetical protein
MNTLHHFVPLGLVGAVLVSCSGAPKESVKAVAPAPVARGTAVVTQLSARVEAVDAGKRLISLKGPRGNVVEFKVGDQVKRLAEIRVGDTITAEYKVAALAELREATAEEKSAPIAAVAEAGRAASDAPPAAGISRAVRVVTTVEALDRSAQTITIKGPLDGMVAVHVDDPSAFGRLQLGQTIVVTFAESLVLAVEPGAKKT